MYHLLLRTGRLSVVEIITVTITQAEKRSQSREWYVYHFKNLKINIFKFMVNIFMDKETAVFWTRSGTCTTPVKATRKLGMLSSCKTVLMRVNCIWIIIRGGTCTTPYAKMPKYIPLKP